MLETSICNVFVVTGSRIATPPADGTILPGVARKRLLALDGLGVDEDLVTIDDLSTAQAVVIVNSVRGPIPVARIVDRAGAEVWSRKSGSVAPEERIMAGWKRLVEREIARRGAGSTADCP